jgi:hypothetical protein
VDRKKESAYFSVRLGSPKGLESLQYPETAFVLSFFATFSAYRITTAATNESATKALTTTLVPTRTRSQYQIQSTFFCAFFAKYSTICSSVTSRRFRLPLFPRRRRPPESDPESSLPLPLASLEEDGESLRRRRRRRLRLRRGESLGSEDASESDGDGLRRRLDDDARRRLSLSRFGMSAMGVTRPARGLGKVNLREGEVRCSCLLGRVTRNPGGRPIMYQWSDVSLFGPNCVQSKHFSFFPFLCDDVDPNNFFFVLAKRKKPKGVLRMHGMIGT